MHTYISHLHTVPHPFQRDTRTQTPTALVPVWLRPRRKISPMGVYHSPNHAKEKKILNTQNS